MDPISVTASIIGIVGLGASVAQGLYTLASRMGDAGREVQIYSVEVSDLTTCFRHIEKVVSKSPARAVAHVDLIRDVLDICQRVLKPFGELQKILNRYLARIQGRKDHKKIRALFGKVRWVFNMKEEVLFYRDVIAAQHRTLQTMLLLLQASAAQDGARALDPVNLEGKDGSNEEVETSDLDGSLEVAIEELKDCIRPQIMQLPSAETDSSSISSKAATLRIEDGDNDLSAPQRPNSNLGADKTSNPSAATALNALVLLKHQSTTPFVDFDIETEPLISSEIPDLDLQIQSCLSLSSQPFAITKIELTEDTRSLARKIIKQAEIILDAFWSTHESSAATADATTITQSQAPASTSFATLAPPSMLTLRKSWVSPDLPILIPKDRIQTYTYFLVAVRAHNNVRPDNPRYLVEGNHYVAITTGLIIAPEVWKYVINQQAFNEVWLAERGELEEIATELQREGKGGSDVMMEFIARHQPKP